jgi:hypothetical protein
MSDVTRVLSAIEQGNPHAAEQLLPLVYEELRKLAAQKMAQEAPGQTLQATALVHEAYLRLVDVEKAQHWNSRGHFFGAAAEAMREGPRRQASLLYGIQPGRDCPNARHFACNGPAALGLCASLAIWTIAPKLRPPGHFRQFSEN